MGIEFRPRNYRDEVEACLLHRVRADAHPLCTSSSFPSSSQPQVDVDNQGRNEFFDPLRGSAPKPDVPVEDLRGKENNLAEGLSNAVAIECPAKEWTSFKKTLKQRFPVSKMISVSSMSTVIMKSGKAKEKSATSLHLKELDDPQKFAEEGVKVISQQEYVSLLHELKDEISRAWQVDDRVTSLKLSIKVARLLMDTSVMQFYPTLFVLATDIMDMIGDMVWERIWHKAQFSEDGTLIYTLPDNFEACNICADAKETCYNWFRKIGSIHELLPRIYLELAILPCSRFLLDKPVDSMQRMVMMIRGIADPLASAYCRVYMVHRAQKIPHCGRGYLITSINDLKVLLMRIISVQEISYDHLSENRGLLLGLIDPAIEYIVRNIFKDLYQAQISDILVGLGLGRSQSELFGKFPCFSLILHHIIKELSSDVVTSNALDILCLIDCSNDGSFDQYLNCRLLGFRLCEKISKVNLVNEVMDKVIEVVSKYNSLDEYLKVIDAYVDIILQNWMDSYVNVILDGIFERTCTNEISENELASLQSILSKLIAHFDNLEEIFALNHFIVILDVMHGSSRSTINIQILNMATRNDRIHEPTTIRMLFEISHALHDSVDFSNMRNNYNQQSARLISRFVQKVDYGSEVERHLTFLNECREAFGSMDAIKETLVHRSNRLAIKAMKGGKSHPTFIKSCLAFSEITIPSITVHFRQLNLYLETSEVALLSGLVSHSDGLIDSAISCFQNVDFVDDLQVPDDVDWFVSLMRKFCSLAVMVPGNLVRGVAHIPKSISSSLHSQSWVTQKMRIRMLCAVISLSATLSQHKLPYSGIHEEVVGNDLLFFGDSTYLQEFLSLSDHILHNIIDIILQEPSKTARGNLALEACNCVALSFKMSPEISVIYSKLMETAKLCLGADDKYLQSTAKFVDRQMTTFI